MNHAPLISIHVPKTAGTAFRQVLEAWYGDKLKLHYIQEGTCEMPAKHDWEDGICIHGHFNSERGFGVRDYYPQASRFITFLRDPYATRLSLYFFLKQSNHRFPFNGRLVTIDALCADIEGFLELAFTHPRTIPGQTFLQFMPMEMTAESYRNDLKKFEHIGICEAMQESVDRLADVLEFPRAQLETVNTSEYDEEIPESGRTLHEKHFPLEHEIYEAVRQLY